MRFHISIIFLYLFYFILIRIFPGFIFWFFGFKQKLLLNITIFNKFRLNIREVLQRN
jgi:hypothetical protein